MDSFAMRTVVNFEPLTCWVCGCLFAVEAENYSVRKRDNKTLFCPNGCRLGFGESEASKFSKEVARLTAAKDQAEAAALKAKTERDAALKAKERQQKRVEKGVCVHCNRSFANLRRHMECKHTGKTNAAH
jgi:hypothetical protein